MSEFSPREQELSLLYHEHVLSCVNAIRDALQKGECDGVVLHAGTPRLYFRDDQEVPFRTNPYFAHMLPVAGAHHLLYIGHEGKPLLIHVRPEDFWSEHSPLGEAFWLEEFDVREAKTPEEAWKELPRATRMAYVGEAIEEAQSHGIHTPYINSEDVLSRLDWQRSFKTEYEIACIEEANHRAAHAHEAARGAFFSGACELEIHEAYLEELGNTEFELPYGAITALNEKSAILHYQGKRLIEDGKTVLIDAGASFLGYASDITRTYATDSSDFLFRGLLGGMETLQQELVEMARPGISFPELHYTAHVKIGRLLEECGIVKLPGEEAAHKELTRAFFPHGLGHFLGINVHDVGGTQKEKTGGILEAPASYPKLRMTRTIEPGMVFTVEPGIYFIESLLAPHRQGSTKEYFDWELIDALMPSGGIRIEDDIVATEGGNRNLTREFLP